MNEKQKQRAQAALQEWRDYDWGWEDSASEFEVSAFTNKMAALLQEMIDAPEPEPFGYFKAEPFGWTDCSETDEGAIALYTAPPAKNQSEQPLEMVNPQAPSVLDGWRPFLTDVVTAAGLLAHGKRDKGLADRIGKFAFDAMRTAPTPAEPPADVALDAERYRWLRDKCRATGEHWGGRWSLVIEGPCPDGDKSSGAIDKAIDAARGRQGGE